MTYFLTYSPRLKRRMWVNGNGFIAHRGWNQGGGDDFEENKISAFEKAIKNGVKAVEIDVRELNNVPVLSHDKPEKGENPLSFEEFAEFAKKNDLKFFIEFKEPQESLFLSIERIIKKYNLQENAFVFGDDFSSQGFLEKETAIQKGLIIEYPWNILKKTKKYNFDTVAMGWVKEVWWSERAFKSFWKIIPIKLVKKLTKHSIMVGVASTKKDIKWLKRQKVDYIVADLEWVSKG